MNIIKKPTPNFATGRSGYKPEAIVIHIMDGSLAGTDSWFASSTSQVSSHYGIGLKGEVHQYVLESDTAWANGRVDKPVSKLVISKPGVNPNKYTLSIEHEGKDLHCAPEIQLQTSAELIRTLCAKYKIPLNREHVISHSEIFSKKPYCCSLDLSIMDKLISLAGAEEMIPVQVPKSKVERVKAYLLTI